MTALPLESVTLLSCYAMDRSTAGFSLIGLSTDVVMRSVGAFARLLQSLDC